MTKRPCYIGMHEARMVLAEIGIELTVRQIKRTADLDAKGKRKLPFFPDPIERRLKIDKHRLLEIYQCCQAQAETNSHAGNAQQARLSGGQH